MAQEDRLRTLMTQRYDPTREGPTGSFVSDFQTRRFDDGLLSELFHENTKIHPLNKHKYEKSASTFVNDPAFLYAVESVRPDYEGYERVSLPEPDDEPTDASLFDVLGERRSVRDFTASDGLSLDSLSNLLYHSLGVSEVEGRKALRRYPSAGALYPVELYFHLSASVGDLDPGLYYYAPDDHALALLDADVDDDDLRYLFADDGSFDYAAAELNAFLTASFWRAYAKYGPRAYRYVFQECGHVCQNLQLVAQALGLGSIPRAGYFDDRINDYLGVDGVNEAVVSVLTVGSSNEVRSLA